MNFWDGSVRPNEAISRRRRRSNEKTLVGDVGVRTTVAAACGTGDPSKNATVPQQKGDSKTMQPVSSGYVDVKGIKLYHEIYGAAEPLVLLHGGLMTIKEMSPLIQALSDKQRVIAT
jgi:hypothetical protein